MIPLVLLSGLLSNEHVWESQVRDLSDIASIEIVSPSQETPKAMVEAILEAAPPKFALAGHSMGGWLCLEVMRAAPTRVTKLCLLNTSARMDSEEKRARRKILIQRVELGQFQEVVREIVDLFVYNSDVILDVEKMFLEVGQEAFIRQERSMMMREECLSILPSIRCPTLVIHSAEDKVFSLEDHQELADHIPNAKLVLVNDAGHMSPMEQPQSITTLLRNWLR